MTPNEHAHEIKLRLRKAHKALDALHKALADAACECGAELGLDEEIMTTALPKEPPPNPE